MSFASLDKPIKKESKSMILKVSKCCGVGVKAELNAKLIYCIDCGKKTKYIPLAEFVMKSQKNKLIKPKTMNKKQDEYSQTCITKSEQEEFYIDGLLLKVTLKTFANGKGRMELEAIDDIDVLRREYNSKVEEFEHREHRSEINDARDEAYNRAIEDVIAGRGFDANLISKKTYKAFKEWSAPTEATEATDPRMSPAKH